jgi:hypothetical protein
LIASAATLDENFSALLAEFTAGDPMRGGVLCTNLSRRETSRRLSEKGTPASRHVVGKLLKKHGLGYAQGLEKKLMGAQPDRNAQFENVGQSKRRIWPGASP